MKPYVSFEAMSILRDTLDVRLVKGEIEIEEWIEIIDSLEWTDSLFLEELSKRW